MRHLLTPQQRSFRLARNLVWAYFLLVIFEGVLRKWVFPSLSSPLLFLRDPILIAIYYLALQNKWYIRNIGLTFGFILAFVTLFVSMQFNPDRAAIALYGFRSNFFHLPLIFIMPRLFDKKDVLTFGRFILIGAFPMAILMAMQFLAPSSSFINAGAGEGAVQIASALGKIRPAGTFSFIVGPVFFFSLTTAFLIYTYFHAAAKNKILIFAALSATLLAFVVSGSRGLAATCLISLFLGLFSMTAVQPSNLKRTLTFFGCLSALVLVAAQIPFIGEAFNVLTTRVNSASEFEGGAVGSLSSRVLGEVVRPFEVAQRVSAPGEGLGVGTIGGGALLTGNRGFSSNGESETEWSRHIIESGPVLGYAFIFFRLYLLFYLTRMAIKSGRRGNSLPLVLLGAIAYSLIVGQLGQSTIAAFIIFTSGLILAACREPGYSASDVADQPQQPDAITASSRHKKRLRAVH